MWSLRMPYIIASSWSSPFRMKTNSLTIAIVPVVVERDVEYPWLRAISSWAERRPSANTKRGARCRHMPNAVITYVLKSRRTLSAWSLLRGIGPTIGRATASHIVERRESIKGHWRGAFWSTSRTRPVRLHLRDTTTLVSTLIAARPGIRWSSRAPCAPVQTAGSLECAPAITPLWACRSRSARGCIRADAACKGCVDARTWSERHRGLGCACR